MVIMVYHTLQMHYSSLILTRLTYIITHIIYVCVCTLWHICVYAQIYMLWIYLCTMGIYMFSYIYIYIYAVFFLCMCVCEHVLRVRK